MLLELLHSPVWLSAIVSGLIAGVWLMVVADRRGRRAHLRWEVDREKRAATEAAEQATQQRKQSAQVFTAVKHPQTTRRAS